LEEITREQIHYRMKLISIKDFDEAFELVKSVVLQKFKMHRAGLSLILQVMPSNIGAYHMLGSNALVLNSYILTTIKKLARCDEEYNSYLFMVLAHEYLHSLGLVDENTVRQMTYDLCNWMLGGEHIATKMAKEDPSTLYPELKSMIQLHFGTEFTVIKDFDNVNQTYIQ
jgi:hypothetical protein